MDKQRGLELKDRRAGTWCLALAALAVLGCRPRGEAPPPAVEVTVVGVVKQDVPLLLEYVGQTESSRQVEIRARVDGYLQKVAYTEGVVVREGALLFQIDPRPLQLMVDAAQAAVLDRISLARNTHQNLERLKPLLAQNAISRKDYEDAVTADQSAQAGLLSARSDEARARMNLGYARITSPLSGLAGRTTLAEGTYINPGGGGLLTTVAQVDPIFVNFSISEDEKLRFDREANAGTLRYPRQDAFEVTLVLSDGGAMKGRGTINFAAPSVDTQTGAYAIRATFPNPGLEVRPGQFVRVRVKGLVRMGALLVPQRAVMQGQAGKFVYVVTPAGTAELRPVEVGEWHGDDWFITSGLKHGDRVVVGGVVKVQPGAPLKITAEPAPGSPAPEARN